MKSLIHTVKLDPTELHKRLSYEDTRRFTQMVRKMIYVFHVADQFPPNSITTKSFWLRLPPNHFFSFDLDITIETDPSQYKDRFKSELTFYDNEGDFLLARELSFIESGIKNGLILN